MTRLALALLLSVGLPGAEAAAAQAPAERPRLLLLISVDQLRYDYLTRFGGGFSSGLARLLREGAVFTSAHLEHYPTVTAVGHATMLSGATPAVSGIVGNDWYDRESGRTVTSVEDPETRLVGADGAGSSPRRLLVSTVADEMKAADAHSRAVGVSLKDRSAILMVGRSADAAFWYHSATGSFVTSTYYAPEPPAWAKEFNARRPADRFAGLEWRELPGADGAAGHLLGTMPVGAGELYAAVRASPFGNDLLEEFAEAALAGERLGQRGATDVLAVSFSSNDGVGHDHGPDSPHVRDITLRTDAAIGRLLRAVDARVGLARTVVALTADHGVAPLPEVLASRRMPGGRVPTAQLVGAVEKALADAYGLGPWVVGTAGSSIYLDRERIARKRLDERGVQDRAARALSALPNVARVLTRAQLLAGAAPRDLLSDRVLRSFHPRRSGDLELLLDPYWIRSARDATHGSLYAYDSHIPLILMGPGIRPGRYHGRVALNDLAPTLATLLEVATPSGSVGRTLDEALDTPRP